jgi:hypothetical protein
MSTSSLRIIVTGFIAQYPLGGMTWHYLQYVLGLQRLGHDVYYLEDTGDAVYSPSDRASTIRDCTFNVEYLARVMARFGLADRWAYRFGATSHWYGLGDSVRAEVIDSAELLLNVSGSLPRADEYRRIPRLAFIDTDPVFNQIKLMRGDTRFCRQLDAHDVHFTFGGRLRSPSVSSGPCWRPTRQPVVLSEWRSATPRRDVFTTVMNWKAKARPKVAAGRAYGQKDMELLRFLDLPGRVAPTVLEVALHAGRGHQAPRQLLLDRGWRVVDPEALGLDFEGYRDYIESSRAEWSIAKHGYVEGRAGWFSERSACYLAAGRPVVVQDTGFAGELPVGEGIVSFNTLDEAVAGIRTVEAQYSRHARAAQAIAETYFDSDTVLARLLQEASRDD